MAKVVLLFLLACALLQLTVGGSCWDLACERFLGYFCDKENDQCVRREGRMSFLCLVLTHTSVVRSAGL